MRSFVHNHPVQSGPGFITGHFHHSKMITFLASLLQCIGQSIYAKFIQMVIFLMRFNFNVFVVSVDCHIQLYDFFSLSPSCTAIE